MAEVFGLLSSSRSRGFTGRCPPKIAQNSLPTDQVPDDIPPHGLAGEFLEHRDALLRFLRARGAGEAAEDLLHDIWVKITSKPAGPVGAPLPYLMRMANTLMIDRYRSARQSEKRERDWVEASAGAVPGVSEEPSPERKAVSEDYARRVSLAIDALGARTAAVFRRHRIDEIPQRQVAAEFGVSLSTVESDLRAAYRALAELREEFDEV